jgi:hypothetical protein
MIILIKSFLWIKLNMNLPKFLKEMAPSISSSFSKILIAVIAMGALVSLGLVSC